MKWAIVLKHCSDPDELVNELEAVIHEGFNHGRELASFVKGPDSRYIVIFRWMPREPGSGITRVTLVDRDGYTR